MVTSAKKEGEIVTFYSYKGGAGRSFALANIAALLAHWKYKVLCVDWDLEAPGLSFYFPQKIRSKKPGLRELVLKLRSSNVIGWRGYVHRAILKGTQNRLDIIYAHADGASLEPIDWEALFTGDFGTHLENLRQRWKKYYDFVLIDSRTGFTDAGAVCTVQLPDTLVFLLTANDQSVKGSVEAVRKAVETRRSLSVERNALRTVPIVSRFDAREEYRAAVSWRSKFKKALTPFSSAWVSDSKVANEIIELTTIPYVSRWSFGEEIVSGREPYDSPEYISYYLANIAALIAHRFERADDLADSRESYLREARLRASDKKRFEFDVYLSIGRPDRSEVQLGRLLKAKGVNVYQSKAADSRLSRSSKALESERLNLLRSRNLVVLIADEPNPVQEYEVARFVRQLSHSNSEQRVIPVFLTPEAIKLSRGLVNQFKGISAWHLPANELADQIFSALK